MFGLNLIGYIGWGLFILTLLAYFAENRRNFKILNIRMSLCAYAKWLLLDDETRNIHKQNFIASLKTGSYPNNASLFLLSDYAVEEMALGLKAEGSLIAVEDLMKKYVDIEN